MENLRAGVYYAGQDFSAESPAFYVERPVARKWLDEGKAWSINHGRDIALTPEAERHLAEQIDGSKLLPTMTVEESCAMGEHVMDANVERRLWARRLVRSWKWRVAITEHMRSLEKRREQGIGNRQQAAGNRQRATGNSKPF